MSNHIEWEEAGVMPNLLRPAQLEELADDDNTAGHYGLGAGGLMVYGSLPELKEWVARASLVIQGEEARLKVNGPDPKDVYRKRLYFNAQGGEVYCYQHLGHYASIEIADDPGGGPWLTDLGLWSVVEQRDENTYQEMYKNGFKCETCGKTFEQTKE